MGRMYKLGEHVPPQLIHTPHEMLIKNYHMSFSGTTFQQISSVYLDQIKNLAWVIDIF
jgi:hypothetical protein